MPDYNIYIRGKSGGDQSANNTVPFDNRPGAEDGTTIDESVAPFIQKGIQQGENFISGGFQSAINTGVATLARAVPWIALGKIALDVTTKTIKTGVEHLENYTGDHTYSMNLNNLTTVVGNTINPVGYGFKVLNFNAQVQKERARIDQEKQLIGNSMLGKVKVGI